MGGRPSPLSLSLREREKEVIVLVEADAVDLKHLADQSVDMIFGSPPYAGDARTTAQGGVSRNAFEWVKWMLLVTIEAQRVCKGPTFWVCAGVTRDRCYWPTPAGLQWEWFKQRGWDPNQGHSYRPSIYRKSCGIPGTGGDDYWRSDWEYVLCFKRPGKLPWSDNTAAGHPPKWGPGGPMSHRLSDGQRVNQWGRSAGGKSGRTRNTDRILEKTSKRPSHKVEGSLGELRRKGYKPTALSNPGNFIDAAELGHFEPWDEQDGLIARGNVGGGHMGDKAAYKHVAAFPEWLAERFIRSFCPPGGIVYDPFCGSGTTLAVANKLGRQGWGSDIDPACIEMTMNRLMRAEAEFVTPRRKGAKKESHA